MNLSMSLSPSVYIHIYYLKASPLPPAPLSAGSWMKFDASKLSGRNLEASRKASGRCLEASRKHFKASEAPFGDSRRDLEAQGSTLEVLGRILEASGRARDPLWRSLRSVMGHFSGSFGPHVANMRPYEYMCFIMFLVVFQGFGGIWEASGGIREASGGTWEVSGGVWHAAGVIWEVS